MARGPFSPVEQPEIGAPQLRQEVLPVSAVEAGAGVFDAVAKGVQAGGQLLAERKEKQLREDLTGNLDAIEQALHATRDPAAMQAIFDGAAQGNPFFQRAKEEFVRISDAVKAGRMPGDFAVTRTKAALRDAIKDAPEFSEELQQAARQALGFSPDAEAFQRALRSSGRSSEQTPGEKAIENLVSLGISEDNARGLVLKSTLNEIESADIRLRIQQGELRANEISALAGLEAEKLTGNVFTEVLAAMQNNGGVFDPATATAVATAQLQSVRAQALQLMPASAPSTSRSTLNTQLDETHNRILKMIENGTMQRMTEQHTDTLAAVTKERAFKLHPFLRSISAVAGDEGAMEALTLFSTYQTEAQRGVLRKTNPMFNAFETLGDLATSMQSGAARLETGVGVGDLSTKERTAIAALDAQTIIAPSAEGPGRERKAQAWDRLVENVGQANTLKLLADPRAKKQVKVDSALQQRAGQAISDQRSTIAQGLQGLSAGERDAISVRDGRLHIDPARLVNLGTEGVQGLSSTAKTLVTDANRLLAVGESYKSMGVIEFDTTAEKLFNVQEAQDATQVDTRARRRRWVPESGTFIDVTGE